MGWSIYGSECEVSWWEFPLRLYLTWFRCLHGVVCDSREYSCVLVFEFWCLADVLVLILCVSLWLLFCMYVRGPGALVVSCFWVGVC